MKKIWMVLIAVSLLDVGMPAVAQEVTITSENIAQIVGKWEGTRDVIKPQGRYSTEFTVVSINTVTPFTAIIKYYGGGRFNGVEFPVEVRINKGKLDLKGGPIEAELVLDVLGPGKMMLSGDFVFRDGPGSFGKYVFYKKN